MNAARRISTDWIEALPAVRGRLQVNAPMSAFTWFRVGGPADMAFRPADESDLSFFLANLPVDIPVTAIGVGSNLLIRDGGVRGVVIRLGGDFNHLSFGEQTVETSAAALDSTVAQAALKQSRAGLEFLSGIPGTIGGALRMNAGAYGRELKDVLISATAIDRSGVVRTLTNQDFGFGYRKSSLPEDLIFLSAVMAAPTGDRDEIAGRMAQIRDSREASQPIRTRTGGSTFANPEGAKAWELIDRAGCRGLRRGGAMISEKHCNFLINTGTATAADLEDLGEDVRERVLKATGFTLHWEIRRIGERA